MHREWIPDLFKKPISTYLPEETTGNNQTLIKRIRNNIKIIYSISLALDVLRNDLKHPYKTILILKFFDTQCMSNQEIADKIGYSSRVFYDKKKIALIEFSETFLNYQQRYNVKPLINLIDNRCLNTNSKTIEFLSALSDKQALNLYATLLQSKSNIPVKQAQKQASISYSFDNLNKVLNESLF